MKYLRYTTEDFIADPYFQQWISGTNNAAGVFWEQWLLEHPEKLPEVEEAARFIQQLQFQKDSLSSEEYTEIWQDIIAHRDIPYYKLQRPNQSFRQRWIAAAVVLLLTVAGAFYLGKDYLFPSTTLVQTGFGDTKKVVLPDGSVAILNANSQLRFEDTWDTDQAREVTLKGEAYFSVQHTEHHQKFRVYSEQLIIEVLGTEFNVNNRRGHNEVVLEKGLVRLDMTYLDIGKLSPQNKQHSLVMEPGELVQISETADINKEIVNPEIYSSWTKNRLIFDNTPLTDIIKMIEDNYGYAVYTQALDIHQLRFSGELHSTDLDLLLAYLSEAFDLQVEKTENKIVLAQNHDP